MKNRVRCLLVAAIGCCVVLCCGCRSRDESLGRLDDLPVDTPTIVQAPVVLRDKDAAVEEIITKEMLKRKFMYWKADRLKNEGVKAMDVKNYPEAIEKLTRAVKILSQLAPGHDPSKECLELLNRYLGICHRDYARILFKKGRAKNDLIKFDQAEANIMAATLFDSSLKSQAQEFMRDLTEQRFWAQFE